MELLIDLIKGHTLDRSRLVQKMIEVHGKNGSFQRRQWVDPKTGEPVNDKHGNPMEVPGKPYSPVPAPLALKHTENHGLDDKELAYRHGEVGPLDLPKLRQGTPLEKAFPEDVAFANEDLGKHDTDFSSHASNLLKGVTKEGLEHVFSAGQFKAEMNGVSMFQSDGHIILDIGFGLFNKSGGYVASISRTMYREPSGELHVSNSAFELRDTYQNHKIGDEIYERSEHLWRHLSDGHPVHISLDANVSVGTYAWARKGFDFYGRYELANAKSELRGFCRVNGVAIKDLLKQNGYEDIEDLEHSWQFSALDDGNDWVLEARSKQDKGVVKGKGHFGKAFMLGGKTTWQGYKKLNDNSLGEQLAGYREKYLSTRRKEDEK